MMGFQNPSQGYPLHVNPCQLPHPLGGKARFAACHIVDVTSRRVGVHPRSPEKVRKSCARCTRPT
jgi:hypothetical protein